MGSSVGHPQSFPRRGGLHRTKLLLPSIPLYRGASSERPRDMPRVIQNGRVRIRTLAHHPTPPHSEIRIKNLYCCEFPKLKKVSVAWGQSSEAVFGAWGIQGPAPTCWRTSLGRAGKGRDTQLPTAQPLFGTLRSNSPAAPVTVRNSCDKSPSHPRKALFKKILKAAT